MTRPLQPCGTTAAALRHWRRGEELCDACREAQRAATEARRGGPNPKPVQPCGTPAGRQRHRDRGEAVCEVCRVAHNAWQSAYRAARRAEQRAQARAATLARLGRIV